MPVVKVEFGEEYAYLFDTDTGKAQITGNGGQHLRDVTGDPVYHFLAAEIDKLRKEKYLILAKGIKEVADEVLKEYLKRVGD